MCPLKLWVGELFCPCGSSVSTSPCLAHRSVRASTTCAEQRRRAARQSVSRAKTGITNTPNNQAPRDHTSFAVGRHRSLSKPECKADVHWSSRPASRASRLARLLDGSGDAPLAAGSYAYRSYHRPALGQKQTES